MRHDDKTFELEFYAYIHIYTYIHVCCSILSYGALVCRKGNLVTEIHFNAIGQLLFLNF